MNRHEKFLTYVRDYVDANPEVAAHIANHVQAGLKLRLDRANDRAADMEVIAATLAARKYKGAEELIKSKLKSLDGQTSLNWSWFLEEKSDSKD